MTENYIYRDGLKSMRLETQYLSESDVKPWEEFLGDRDSTQYILPQDPRDVAERSKSWIDFQLRRYADKKYGLQGLWLKETGELVGQCGLLTQNVDGREELEVGYHILKKHWGKGFAPEAAKLFIDFALEKGVSDSVISIIHKDNERSKRVAEKNGLKFEKALIWKELDVHIYRIKK